MTEPQPKRVKTSPAPVSENDNVPERPLILQLPAEIRCQIWRTMVVSPKPIKPRHRPDRVIEKSTKHIAKGGRRRKYYQMRKPTSLVPAFTCCTIYHEMTLLYYSENLFDLDINLRGFYELSRIGKLCDWNPCVKEFAKAIGSTNFGLIKKVRVDCSPVFVDSPPHFAVPFRRIGDFSILQRGLYNIKNAFRKDVKLIPYHEDEKFAEFMTRHFEKALGTLRKPLPLVGFIKRPTLME